MASIRKRGENSYQITVSCGYNSQGKKLFKQKTVTRPDDMTDRQWQKELEKLSLEFERAVENGTYLDGGKLTFAEFMERWIQDHAEKQLENKTLYRYKEIISSRILPVLGHIKLQKLQPTHLLQFYNNLLETGIRSDSRYILKENYSEILAEKKTTLKEIIEKINIKKQTSVQLRLFRKVTSVTAKKISEASGIKLNALFEEFGNDRGLSEKTIKQHHAIIHSALKKAVEWQLIFSNPADRVKPPKVQKKEARHLKENQVTALLEALEKEPLKYQVMVCLDLITGMRRGELMALEWKDIDLEKRTISITKSLEYIPQKGLSIKQPKNEPSKRKVAIPKPIISLILEYKLFQNGEKAKVGDDLWKGEDWLFTKWDGELMHPDTISKWFPKFLQRHNLPVVNFHAIRHTAATLLINQGLDVKAVSSRLGHANASTTLNIYSHAFQTADSRAADMMKDFVMPKNKKQEENVDIAKKA